MRPHHLVIEGFGPFRDRQTVDFDSVSHDGLFLIAGPTGAGKTSILDALCFALFNTVPGPRGSASDLRSHLTSPTDPTRVELTFTASGRRFRIERTPQYSRPRKRGTGMTTQNHTVALAEWVDNQWAGISRTAQETQAFLDGVIGLNAAQFTKLVVLPQGDFAAFLHADPAERESILEKLFATEHFRLVERVLGERATQARRHTEQGDHKRRFAIESASQSSWEVLPLPPATPGVIDTLAFLGAASVSAQERAQVADTTAQLAEQHATSASQTAQHWRQRIDDRAAHTALLNDETAWAESVYDRESLRLKADRARSSHALRHHLNALRRSQSEALRLDEVTGRAEDDALKAVPSTAQVLLDELTDNDLSVALAHLDRINDRLHRLAHLKEQVKTAVAALTAAETDVEGAQTLLAAQEAEAKELRKESESLRDTFDVLDATASIRDKLREHKRLVAAVQTALAQRDAAQAHTIHSSQTAEITSRSLEATRRAMQEDSAGALASSLADGQPCPVCGACEHPHPARPTDGGPTVDDEARAEAADTAARSTSAAAQASFEAAEDNLETARAAAADIDADGLEDRLAEAESAVTRRSDIRTAIITATTRLRAITPHLDAVREAVRSSQAGHASATTVHAEALSRLAELTESGTSQTPEAWRKLGVPEPEDHVSARRTRGTLETLEGAHQVWTRARNEAIAGRRDARARDTELTTALADSPFTDLASLEAAALLPLDELEQQLEKYRAHAARLALRRDADPVVRARHDTLDDETLTATAMQAATTAEQERARADASTQHAAVSHATAQSAHVGFLRAVADRTEDEDRIAELQRDVDLAELVLGTSTDATNRMSLSSFALASLFADVAANASDRLVDMTAGRYRFTHDLERRRGDRRAGLGLKIVDTFTDESRDPRTLSGGEGFMASLALALGMADTVRGETGGIDLDALFLDEGFGTLDPDTLSDVLAVLDRLRTGGRTIGIISHVSELQQAITTRIMVEPGPTGARIRVESPHLNSDE